MNSYIDELVKRNEAPILFIGSGVSKRYIEKSPDWHSLLKFFWDELDFGSDFYGKLSNLRHDSDATCEAEKDFYANIRIASIISERYNKLFNDGRIQIDNFTTEIAYKTGISPFKMAVANVFKEYKLKEEKIGEIRYFKDLLAKSQFIITTNYDTFIEDQYTGGDIEKYIGAKGFFSQSFDYSEIYKIHGCVTSPQDIIITEEDYSNFKNKEILVSSKIVSMLMDNPILFLGYSMTDLNIRNIIKNVSSALSIEELKIFSEKVTVVEWQEGENEIIEELQNDRDLGCTLRLIKTDNYELLFKRIAEIDPGMPLSLVRKFKSKIKDLITDRAKEGALETVLIYEKDLDDIDISQEKNLVVAMGTDRILFRLPNIISYCIDYISEKDELPMDVRLRFISTQNIRARIPVNRILNNDAIERSEIDATEKEKLRQQRKYLSNYKYHKKKITESAIFNMNTSSLNEILNEKKGEVKTNETIAWNMENLNLNEVKKYILETLELLRQNGKKVSTSFRKVILIYDIIKCKRDNA